MNNRNLSRWLLAVLVLTLFCATGCTKRVKANRHLQRANAYYAADQYDRAEIEYLNVLRLDGTNRAAIHHLGAIYYANESYHRAAPFLNAAKQLDPSDVESRGKLARLAFSAGAVKQALTEADAILQLSPTNEDALLILADAPAKPEEIKTNLQRIATLQQKAGDHAIFHVASGVIALKQNDPKTAESQFKAAVALEPKSALAHTFLGALYAEQNNTTLAEPALKAAADLSPVRSQRRLKYATYLAQTGGADAAKNILKDLTIKAPDYLPAWILSARVALNQTNYAACDSDLKQVLARDTENYEALLLRSDLELAQDKPQQAISTLEKVVEKFPKSAVARYAFGVACARNKDISRATVALNQAVTLDPQLVPAVLLLADLNIRKGETGPAIESLTRLIKANPHIEKAHVLLGNAYLAAGRYNDALAAYNEVVQKFPRNAEGPYLIGVTLRLQGRTAEARKVFEKIALANPEDRATTMQLIGLDFQAKDINGAARRIQEWIDKAPKDANPQFEMAKLRYSRKDLKGAEVFLQKAIDLDQNAIGAYVLFSRILLESGQTDLALEKANAGLAKNPKDPAALLLAATLYESKRDFKNASETYEKLLALNPQNIVALNNLAAIYGEHLGQLDKAIALARTAEELSPDSPAVTDTYGWVLSLRGEYGQAIGFLKDSAQHAPTEPEILGHLGLTQYMMGDETGARASFQNALKLAPAFNRRDQVEQCLALLDINPNVADGTAVSTLEKWLQEKPADPIALARLGLIYNKTGKTDKAVAIYEKALAANPKLAIAAARLAEFTERSQNPAKALELARNARKLDSSDPEIAHIAGRIACESIDLKDQQWGLSLLQESSQKKASDPNLAYDLAWAFYSQGRVADAESAMKTAMANNPDPALAANAKRFLGFLPLADPVRAASQQAQIDQALQADAQYLPALAARAAATQQKGDSAAALKVLDQILARNPGFAPALRSFTILSAAQPADARNALAAATRARELFPDDVEVARAVGIINYHRADYSKAARMLEDVSKKRPEDENVWFYLGMSQAQLKQNSQSKTALKKALSLKPQATFASEAQRILNELK